MLQLRGYSHDNSMQTGVEPVTLPLTKYDCTTTLFKDFQILELRFTNEIDRNSKIINHAFSLCPEPDSNWYSLLQKISIKPGITRFPTELPREAVRCCGLLGYSPLFSLPQTCTLATGDVQKRFYRALSFELPGHFMIYELGIRILELGKSYFHIRISHMKR